ncbi:MAG: helix-turn-helix domain-containing protein [Hyphomicrobiaceae bacterium]
MKVVGGQFGVSEAEMRSGRRSARVHKARCIAVYLAGRLSGATRAEVGIAFNRDPTIVAMYCRAIERQAAESVECLQLLRELEQSITLRQH